MAYFARIFFLFSVCSNIIIDIIIKYELFTNCIIHITDQELATAVIEGEKRNWKGILMAILVIIIMCSFIAATVFLLSPQIREYHDVTL